VPVAFAFGLAPAVFVAAHLYTLIRYDMLAGNLRRFNAELAATVPVAADRERCRQLLANIEFVSALAMPRGSAAASWLFRATVVALLAVFPVLVLLLVHIGALRLQSEVVNACTMLRWAADFWRAPLRRKLLRCWLPVVVMAMDAAWLNVPSADARDTVQLGILYARFGAPSLRYRLERVRLAWQQPIDLLLCSALGSGWGAGSDGRQPTDRHQGMGREELRRAAQRQQRSAAS